MKTPLRVLLISLATLAVLLLAGAGIVLTPAFQTWAARRALAAQPGTEVSLGRLAADFQSVRVEALQVRHAGAVLKLPVAEARLSLFDAALRNHAGISRLTAKGWTLDLTNYAAAGAKQAAADSAVTAVALVFSGVFDHLQLPVGLALDGVELEGVLVLPGPPGQAPVRAVLTVQGGGLSANREGRFNFSLRAEINGRETPVNRLEFDGYIEATMDAERAFTRLAVNFDARAAGPALPQPVTISAELGAARVRGGENFTLHLQSFGKRLVDLQANYPAQSARVGGVWKLDLRDTDLAPFVLGVPLPMFEAVGAGMFESDTGFRAVQAAARLQATAGRLGSLRPELDAIGPLALFSEFDLTLHDGSLRIDRLNLNVNQSEPVLAVQSQQAFEFNPRTGELKVADPAADLVVVNLFGLPVRWLAPFVQPYALGGGMLRGELKAGAVGGGLMLRSTAPLQVDDLALAEAGQPLLANLDLKLDFSADYSPLGWQADLTGLKASTGAAPWFSLSAKAGRLAGPDQLTKITGSWTADLPGVMQQPFARDAAVLTRGRMAGQFTGSLGERRELQASVRLEELAVGTGEPMPLITAELRAAAAVDGDIAFNLPLGFANQSKNRRSDLTLSGTLQVLPDGLQVDARATSTAVYLEDLQVLAALTGASAPAAGLPGLKEPPFWQGIGGRMELALKKLHYNDLFEVSEVQGTVRIERGALRLDNLRAGLGEGGSASLNGGILYEPSAAKPYALSADLAVQEFNPKPLLLALRPGQSVTVDGNFNITSRLSGRADTVLDLPTAAQGDFLLTSRGGIFRGLPVSIAGRVESTGRIAAGVAAVGSLLGSVTGKKEFSDIANKAQAVSELGKAFSAIAYDQLSVVLERDQSLAAVLRDFTLIAPELRVTGEGKVAPKPGCPWLDGPLTMEFKLRARGQTAHLLNYLGTLASDPDELGYAACNLPLRIGGTLAAPDASELNVALANLALEKSGAGNLLDRLLGGGK